MEAKYRIGRLEMRHVSHVVSVAEECFSKVWRANEFAYFLEHDDRVCFGAFTASGSRELVGFALGLLIQGDLDIISIAVRPSSRRAGLGHRLLEKLMQADRVERTFLEVDVENAAAIGLYQKLGFEIVGTRKGYYEQTRDAHLMRHTGGKEF